MMPAGWGGDVTEQQQGLRSLQLQFPVAKQAQPIVLSYTYSSSCGSSRPPSCGASRSSVCMDEAPLHPRGLGENLGLQWDCMQVNLHKWVLAGGISRECTSQHLGVR